MYAYQFNVAVIVCAIISERILRICDCVSLVDCVANSEYQKSQTIGIHTDVTYKYQMVFLTVLFYKNVITHVSRKKTARYHSTNGAQQQ